MTQITTHTPTEAPAPMLAYASGIHPPVEKETQDPSAAVRTGELLVALHGTTLPTRCVLCGDDGIDEPIKLTFTWDASFTLTRVSTLELRQQAHVHAFLCVVHRTRWASARFFGSLGIALASLLMLAGGVLGVISESSAMPRWTPLAMAIMTAGFALLIVAMFFFTLRSRTLTCQKIQEGYLYLEGASPRFLSQLNAE